MRQVAVTEGDKVEAQIRFGYTVNGYGIGELVARVNQVTDAEIDKLVAEYEQSYTLDAKLRKGGAKHASLREAAKVELGLRGFLEAGDFKAFTDTFEDLHGLSHLPGIAVQRLMNDGYGFGAEGDWILVHDAVRPCVPREALARLVDDLADDRVGGLLALPLADTLKHGDGEVPARVLRTEDRKDLWLAQTPQMFRYGLLRSAYALDAAREPTDEAQAIECLAATGACAMPRLVAGSAANIKVTFPDDLALAAAILANQGDA
jgi:hypothetical protein